MQNGEAYEDKPRETRQQWMDRIRSEGFVVIAPQVDQLQVDIDSEAQYAAFLASWAPFCRAMTALHSREPSYVERPSMSGLPRRHITVTLPFEIFDPVERIAWQAALGSDPMREMLSLLRNERGEIAPTVFVESQS